MKGNTGERACYLQGFCAGLDATQGGTDSLDQVEGSVWTPRKQMQKPCRLQSHS